MLCHTYCWQMYSSVTLSGSDASYIFREKKTDLFALKKYKSFWAFHRAYSYSVWLIMNLKCVSDNFPRVVTAKKFFQQRPSWQQLQQRQYSTSSWRATGRVVAWTAVIPVDIPADIPVIMTDVLISVMTKICDDFSGDTIWARLHIHQDPPWLNLSFAPGLRPQFFLLNNVSQFGSREPVKTLPKTTGEMTRKIVIRVAGRYLERGR